MKHIGNKIFMLTFLIVTITGNIVAQKVSKVKGTIGKEKSDQTIVVCVLGTKACMPLTTNENMKTDLNGKMVSLKELPVGIYIEADLEETNEGNSRIKKIKTDINKTVICFIEMNEEDKKKLGTLLKNTNGVNNYKFYNKSLQVYIEYNHEIINYTNLEGLIVKKGFHIE